MTRNLRIKKALFSLCLSSSFVLSSCSEHDVITENVIIEKVEDETVVEDIEINIIESSNQIIDGVETTQETKEEKLDIELLKELYSDVTTNMYTKTYLNLREGKSTDTGIITVIDKCQKIYEIERYEEWSLIKYNDVFGYVHNSYIDNLPEDFIEVDISEQNIKYHLDNNILLDSDIVTGRENIWDTRIGMFSIYSRETSRYLTGRDSEGNITYQSYVDYWMPFDGGIGLHDASWRDEFGGEIYKTSGSHGCVNLPFDIAKQIYENSEIGTKVLVHK